MSAKNKTQKSAKSADVLDDIAVEQTVTSTSTATSKRGEGGLKEFSKTGPFAFNAKNYKLLFIGLAVNILGFLLMIGGAAENLNDFNKDELFGHRRITIAPMLIVLGYIIIMYSIMKKQKSTTK